MPDGARHLAHIELILHELRTPVNVAAGSIAQLLEPESGDLTPSQQTIVLRAQRACAQLEQITEDLRDWVQLACGAPLLSPTPLGPALETAARAAEATRREAVRVALPEGLGQEWRVPTPAGLLERALTGVLTACVRTAPDRASVPVVLNAELDGRTIELIVGAMAGDNDNDPFDAERMGGLGFALPLARAIIEASGGRVWSSAAGGRVTGIGVHLPAERPSARG